jgi:hypothetical protein
VALVEALVKVTVPKGRLRTQRHGSRQRLGAEVGRGEDGRDDRDLPHRREVAVGHGAVGVAGDGLRGGHHELDAGAAVGRQAGHCPGDHAATARAAADVVGTGKNSDYKRADWQGNKRPDGLIKIPSGPYLLQVSAQLFWVF